MGRYLCLCAGGNPLVLVPPQELQHFAQNWTQRQDVDPNHWPRNQGGIQPSWSGRVGALCGTRSGTISSSTAACLQAAARSGHEGGWCESTAGWRTRPPAGAPAQLLQPGSQGSPRTPNSLLHGPGHVPRRQICWKAPPPEIQKGSISLLQTQSQLENVELKPWRRKTWSHADMWRYKRPYRSPPGKADTLKKRIWSNLRIAAQLLLVSVVFPGPVALPPEKNPKQRKFSLKQ